MLFAFQQHESPIDRIHRKNTPAADEMSIEKLFIFFYKTNGLFGQIIQRPEAAIQPHNAFEKHIKNKFYRKSNSIQKYGLSCIVFASGFLVLSRGARIAG